MKQLVDSCCSEYSYIGGRAKKKLFILVIEKADYQCYINPVEMVINHTFIYLYCLVCISVQQAVTPPYCKHFSCSFATNFYDGVDRGLKYLK